MAIRKERKEQKRKKKNTQNCFITFKKIQKKSSTFFKTRFIRVHRCIDGFFFIFHWKNEHIKSAHKWERNEERKKVTNTQNILFRCSQNERKRRNIHNIFLVLNFIAFESDIDLTPYACVVFIFEWFFLAQFSWMESIEVVYT